MFFLVAAALIAAVAWASIHYLLLPPLVAYLLAINLITFTYYGLDKLAARRQWTRVPERVLHLLALLGGSPAALAGQRAWRHKTIKGRFRACFWAILFLQAIATAALLYYSLSRYPGRSERNWRPPTSGRG